MSKKFDRVPTRGRGRPEPASGATARARARRADGRGSIGEDVRRRLDETICGPLANAPSCPRAGGKCLRPSATRGPRKKCPSLAKNPLRTRG